MTSDAERALWALEEAVDGLLAFVKGATYGLRLAVKRVGDVAKASPTLSEAAPSSAAEMERLVKALTGAEDYLSDVTILALGDHFRTFLARAVDLADFPNLPPTPQEVEALTGTPGALAKISHWFPLSLQLYGVVLRGGKLDRRAMQALGQTDLEIASAGGKVKLYREGSHVTLTEHQIEEAAHACVEAARAICRRLLMV